MVQFTKKNNGTFIISQLNFNIEIGIFEIFIPRLLHEKKISTSTSKKKFPFAPFDLLGEKKPIWKKGVRYVLY